MKKTLTLLCMFILPLLVMAGCSQPQDTTQTLESKASDVITDTTELDGQPSEASTQVEDENPDFYAVCTSYSKTEVEQFARDVRGFILASDWESLAECIAYPITIDGAIYENSTDFVNAPFETMLNTKAVEAIRNESCTDLFCNYSGIMMGNGEVWIGEVLSEDAASCGLHVTGLQILKSE